MAGGLAISNIACLVLSSALLAYGYPYADTFALSTLLGGAGLLMVGGAMDMLSTPLSSRIRSAVWGVEGAYSSRAHREAQRKGLIPIAVGALLIMESVLLSLLIMASLG